MSDPESRNEALLGNLLGESNEFGEPQSANEAILQNMLGANNVLREPQSRIESMLKEILDGGGMGGADMTAYTKSSSKNAPATLKWEFTEAGTFYICIVASYSESSSTTVNRSSLTYTNGDSATVTVIKNSNSIYAYKVVVADGEAADMYLTFRSSLNSVKLYFSAWTLCGDKYETAPFTIT